MKLEFWDQTGNAKRGNNRWPEKKKGGNSAHLARIRSIGFPPDPTNPWQAILAVDQAIPWDL